MMTLISAVTTNVTTILIATAAPVESSSSDSSLLTVPIIHKNLFTTNIREKEWHLPSGYIDSLQCMLKLVLNCSLCSW